MDSPVLAAISLMVGIFFLPPGTFLFVRLLGGELMLQFLSEVGS